MTAHTCLFCKSPEVAFVEILVWDGRMQQARELLLQGVCGAHAAGVKAHPSQGGAAANPKASIFTLYPELAGRIPRMRAMHRTQFTARDEHGTLPTLSAAPALELSVGMRLYKYDSPEGGMVRAARDKAVNTAVAGVHDGLDIEIERVPDEAALLEVVRDQAKR